MQTFIENNWFRLITGISMLCFSVGFLIRSVSVAHASYGGPTFSVPATKDGSIRVTLSEAQINQIMPKNQDGTINVRLTNDQLESLKNQEIQNVNIAKIGGDTPYTEVAGSVLSSRVALGVIQK